MSAKEPAEYQLVTFRWATEPTGCADSFHFRYRNVQDQPTGGWYNDEPLELPASTLSATRALAIPGIKVEAEVSAVVDGAVASSARHVAQSGMSPIGRGVAPDQECPAGAGDVALFSTLSEDADFPDGALVVPIDRSLVVDTITPRLRSVQVLGCLALAADAELNADRILIAGKLVGGEGSADAAAVLARAGLPLALANASIVLHDEGDYEPEDAAGREGGGVAPLSTLREYRFPVGCSGDDCVYVATWDQPETDEVESKFEFVLCTTLDWAAIGFSADRNMPHSDIAVAAFERSAGGAVEVEVTDRWSEGWFRPALDVDLNGRSNVEGLGSWSEGERACGRFTKDVFSQDGAFDLDLSQEIVPLFAAGLADPATGDIQQHTFAHAWEEAVYLDEFAQETTEASAVSDGDEFQGMVGRKVLAVYGNGTIDLHAQSKGRSWVQLDGHAASGDTAIEVSPGVPSWAEGDEIVIMASEGDGRKVGKTERRRIAGVRQGGRLLDLDSALDHRHHGAVQDLGGGTVLDMRAEVALLTRHVVIRGANNEGTRNAAARYGGHTIFWRGARVSVSGVELYDMGQEKIQSRYPIHFHLFGPAEWDANVSDVAIHDTFWRGFTLHGCEGVTLADSVLFNLKDKAVWFEEGSEEKNVIRGNFIAQVRGGGSSGIWFENCNNDVIGNHIAQVDTALDFRLGDGRGHAVSRGNTFTVTGVIVPVGSVREVLTPTRPFGTMRDNVVHAARQLTHTWRDAYSCIGGAPLCGAAYEVPFMPMRVRDTTAYGVGRANAEYFGGDLRFDGSIFGDMCGWSPAAISPQSGFIYDAEGGGYYSHTKSAHNVTFVLGTDNPEISCSARTFALGLGGVGLRITDSRVIGHTRLVRVPGIDKGALGPGGGLRYVVLRNVSFQVDKNDPPFWFPNKGKVQNLASRYAVIDTDASVAPQLSECNGGSGSLIVPRLATMYDPSVCDEAPYPDAAFGDDFHPFAVCHPDSSLEGFTVKQRWPLDQEYPRGLQVPLGRARSTSLGADDPAHFCQQGVNCHDAKPVVAGEDTTFHLYGVLWGLDRRIVLDWADFDKPGRRAAFCGIRSPDRTVITPRSEFFPRDGRVLRMGVDTFGYGPDATVIFNLQYGTHGKYAFLTPSDEHSIRLNGTGAVAVHAVPEDEGAPPLVYGYTADGRVHLELRWPITAISVIVVPGEGQPAPGPDDCWDKAGNIAVSGSPVPAATSTVAFEDTYWSDAYLAGELERFDPSKGSRRRGRRHLLDSKSQNPELGSYMCDHSRDHCDETPEWYRPISKCYLLHCESSAPELAGQYEGMHPGMDLASAFQPLCGAEGEPGPGSGAGDGGGGGESVGEAVDPTECPSDATFVGCLKAGCMWVAGSGCKSADWTCRDYLRMRSCTHSNLGCVWVPGEGCVDEVV